MIHSNIEFAFGAKRDNDLFLVVKLADEELVRAGGRDHHARVTKEEAERECLYLVYRRGFKWMTADDIEDMLHVRINPLYGAGPRIPALAFPFLVAVGGWLWLHRRY